MNDWQALDKKHVWHPYTQMHNAPMPIPVVRAQGAYLYTTEGRAILDGIASWWVNLHGHNVPRLNMALHNQAQQMSQVMFAGFTHEPGARLAAALARRVGLQHVFYSDNGSTAVEVGLKMAYQYWHNQGQTQRTLFVAFENAYHGDTFGAMAASGVELFHSAFDNLLFTVQRAHGALCPTHHNQAPCEHDCPQTLPNILKRHHEHIAGIIVEPMIQGAGGMLIWPANLLREISQAAKEYGIPLIADEVFTGFGRTGKLFACEHAGVQADIVCLSKALTAGYLPLGATLASEAIYQAFLSDNKRHTFFHGHSFTGNALSCAVALESLQLLDELQQLKRVQELSQLYKKYLGQLSLLPHVKNTRYLGAIAVVELKTQSPAGYLHNIGPKLSAAFLQHDILLRPLGNVLYFLPPLCISNTEVEHVFATIEKVITHVCN